MIKSNKFVNYRIEFLSCLPTSLQIRTLMNNEFNKFATTSQGTKYIHANIVANKHNIFKVTFAFCCRSCTCRIS